MSLCPHNINIKHRRCDICEEIAEAELRVYEKTRNDRGIDPASLIAALEKISKATVSVPCDDPQCGDSTWDHECTAGRRKPSRLAEIALEALKTYRGK